MNRKTECRECGLERVRSRRKKPLSVAIRCGSQRESFNNNSTLREQRGWQGNWEGKAKKEMMKKNPLCVKGTFRQKECTGAVYRGDEKLTWDWGCGMEFGVIHIQRTF